MGRLREIGQHLGLIYRDDGDWRLGWGGGQTAGLSRKSRRRIAVVFYSVALVLVVINIVLYVASSEKADWLPGMLSPIGIALGGTGLLMAKDPDPRSTEELVSLLDEADRLEIEAMAARGERVRAIRRLRDLTGLQLVDTKRMYDSLRP